MRSSDSFQRWTEILARPRTFLRGDPVPAEMCESMSAAKILVVSTLVGIFVPDPFGPIPISNVVCGVAGLAMVHPAGKCLALRWAADNLKARHVLVEDEASGELFFRAEVNTLGSQWLPIAVFRLGAGKLNLASGMPHACPIHSARVSRRRVRPRRHNIRKAQQRSIHAAAGKRAGRTCNQQDGGSAAVGRAAEDGADCAGDETPPPLPPPRE